MSTKEETNAITINNSNQLDSKILKHNIMIIMTDDQDQRCYSCWYVIKKSNQYICYFEKNNKPNQKDNKPYWPKVYPITKTSNCLRDIVDYVHKFGGSKFYLVDNYQCGSKMDYNTIISKI